MADERLARFVGVLLGMHTQIDAGTGGWHDGIDGLVDRQHVDAGHGDRRSGPEPRAEASGAEERQPVAHLRELAELLLGERGARPLLAAKPRDGDVPLLVVQRRQRMQERQQRVRRGAAVLAAVLRPPERPHRDRHRGRSAERDGQRRDAGPDAAHVGNQHRVAPEPLGVAWRIGVERAPDFLLALDDDLDADRRPAVERTERADVREHVGLGVGNSAAVERTIPLDRLERRRVPLRLVARRDDVVVPVQQDRRRAGRRRNLAGHDRVGIRKIQGADVPESGTPQQLNHHRRRFVHGSGRKARLRDRRDAREPHQLGRQLRHQPIDRFGDGAAASGGRFASHTSHVIPPARPACGLAVAAGPLLRLRLSTGTSGFVGPHVVRLNIQARGDASITNTPRASVSTPSASTVMSTTCDPNLPLIPAKKRTDAKMIVNSR